MLLINTKKNANILNAVKKLNAAKNELVLAAISLEAAAPFPKTIAEIKETVGDITVSITHLESYLGVGE